MILLRVLKASSLSGCLFLSGCTSRAVSLYILSRPTDSGVCSPAANSDQNSGSREWRLIIWMRRHWFSGTLYRMESTRAADWNAARRLADSREDRLEFMLTDGTDLLIRYNSLAFLSSFCCSFLPRSSDAACMAFVESLARFRSETSSLSESTVRGLLWPAVQHRGHHCVPVRAIDPGNSNTG
jgi:hypothetical protein